MKQNVVSTWTCDHCGCHTQTNPTSGIDAWGTLKLDRHDGVDGPTEKTRNDIVLLLCGLCFDHFDPLQNKDWKP